MSISNSEVSTISHQARWISFKEYDIRWSGYWFKLRCSNCGFVVPDGAGAPEPVCKGCGARMKCAVGTSTLSLSEVIL